MNHQLYFVPYHTNVIYLSRSPVVNLRRFPYIVSQSCCKQTEYEAVLCRCVHRCKGIGVQFIKQMEMMTTEEVNREAAYAAVPTAGLGYKTNTETSAYGTLV